MVRVLLGRERRSRKAVHVLQGFPSLSRIIFGGGFLSFKGGFPLPFSTDSACKGRSSDMDHDTTAVMSEVTEILGNFREKGIDNRRRQIAPVTTALAYLSPCRTTRSLFR